MGKRIDKHGYNTRREAKMVVYQQYGTGTKTETKKKKSDDDGVGVGTKNTNTNTNRSSSVVALMSTLMAVVLVVIVMYVQSSSASFSSTALDANLLHSGTGTNTVIIDDSAAAGVVAATTLPTKIGALLSSFILSNTVWYGRDSCACVDLSTGEDIPWRNACVCLVDICPNQLYRSKQDQNGRGAQIAADRFSWCDKHEEEFDDDFETCLDSFPYNQPESATELVECFLKYYRTCFSLHPPSPSRT